MGGQQSSAKSLSSSCSLVAQQLLSAIVQTHEAGDLQRKKGRGQNCYFNTPNLLRKTKQEHVPVCVIKSVFLCLVDDIGDFCIGEGLGHWSQYR